MVESKDGFIVEGNRMRKIPVLFIHLRLPSDQLFFLIPLGIIFTYSFMCKGLYGELFLGFALMLTAHSNITFLKITASTLYIALFSTLAIIVLAIPSAYFMARSRHKSFFLFLVIIPFWTNFLIRIYAWIAIWEITFSQQYAYIKRFVFPSCPVSIQ